MSILTEMLPFGVVLLRGALADPDQQAIVSSIVKQVRVEPKTALLLEKDIKYAQLLMWNWPDRYGSMCADDVCSEPPEDVFAFASPLLAAIRESLATTTASYFNYFMFVKIFSRGALAGFGNGC